MGTRWKWFMPLPSFSVWLFCSLDIGLKTSLSYHKWKHQDRKWRKFTLEVTDLHLSWKNNKGSSYVLTYSSYLLFLFNICNRSTTGLAKAGFHSFIHWPQMNIYSVVLFFWVLSFNKSRLNLISSSLQYYCFFQWLSDLSFICILQKIKSTSYVSRDLLDSHWTRYSFGKCDEEHTNFLSSARLSALNSYK